MQEMRHEADYDPHRRFMESEVKADIFMVQSVLKAFKQTRAEDRRAFCAWVLVRDRRG
jgi:hypothetical protein